MLWTFGCSHTVGHGLPDCINTKDHNKPLSGVTSKYGWAAALGRLMNTPLTNCGLAGVGPTVVWYRCMTADIQPNDTVIIMWPCWESRVDIIVDPEIPMNSDSHAISLRNWDLDHLPSKIYFEETYSQYHLWYQWHLYMTQIHYHFNVLRKKDNIKLIQTLFSPYEPDIEPPNFSLFQLTKVYFGHKKYTEMPKALDGNHNGVRANRQFAKDLYAEISNIVDSDLHPWPRD